MPLVGSIYIFLMYLILSDVAWQIQVLVAADTFKEIILQRLVGAKGNFLVKNRKKHPFGIEANIGDHLSSCLLCFFFLPYICRLHFFPLSKLVSLSPLQF